MNPTDPNQPQVDPMAQAPVAGVPDTTPQVPVDPTIAPVPQTPVVEPTEPVATPVEPVATPEPVTPPMGEQPAGGQVPPTVPPVV
jgi:hypothetical protein